jgi:hypothetical protein
VYHGSCYVAEFIWWYSFHLRCGEWNVYPEDGFDGYSVSDREKAKAGSPAAITTTRSSTGGEEAAQGTEPVADDPDDGDVEGSETGGPDASDHTKYGWYEGDPLAQPLHKVTMTDMIEMNKFLSIYDSETSMVAALLHRTFFLVCSLSSAARSCTLRPLTGEDLMLLCESFIGLSRPITVSVEPRPMDIVIFKELVQLLNMNSDEIDSMLGAKLYPLGKTTRVERLMQDDIDKDIPKYPKLTQIWAENKIKEYEGTVARSDDRTQPVTMRAAHSKTANGKSTNGKTSNAGVKSTGGGGGGAKQQTQGKWCDWCKAEGDYTLYCTDTACPEEVKKAAKALFEASLSMRRTVNASKKQGPKA